LAKSVVEEPGLQRGEHLGLKDGANGPASVPEPTLSEPGVDEEGDLVGRELDRDPEPLQGVLAQPIEEHAAQRGDDLGSDQVEDHERRLKAAVQLGATQLVDEDPLDLSPDRLAQRRIGREPILRNRFAVPRFDGDTIRVFEKSITKLRPSVARPSSMIARNRSRILGCAFSISSNSSTADGCLGTASVSCPPCWKPTYPGGEPSSLEWDTSEELADVDADEGDLPAEDVLGERLGRLGLPDARRAREEERGPRSPGRRGEVIEPDVEDGIGQPHGDGLCRDGLPDDAAGERIQGAKLAALLDERPWPVPLVELAPALHDGARHLRRYRQLVR
jgi:hypothetical protein